MSENQEITGDSTIGQGRTAGRNCTTGRERMAECDRMVERSCAADRGRTGGRDCEAGHQDAERDLEGGQDPEGFMPDSVRIVLASGSPRRRDLLAREGIPFTIRVSDADETLEPDLLAHPEEAAKKLAERKAGVVVQELLDEGAQGTIAVIGADTIVVHDGVIFGKPENPSDARRMLSTLSGDTHEVITGVSVWLVNMPEDGNVSLGFRTLAETSRVRFKKLAPGLIESYVATGEPMDKAGAYGIQSVADVFVDEVSGDFDTVVGLPVKRIVAEFSEIFGLAR